MLQVEQHLASHQAELNDAVLAVAAANPQGGKPAVESLPVALRTPGILAVMVSDRHITLDVTHNPDTTRGFRIWAGTPDRDFDDKPTAIPGVYRFVYCNDYPESPTNRPD